MAGIAVRILALGKRAGLLAHRASRDVGEEFEEPIGREPEVDILAQYLPAASSLAPRSGCEAPSIAMIWSTRPRLFLGKTPKLSPTV